MCLTYKRNVGESLLPFFFLSNHASFVLFLLANKCIHSFYLFIFTMCLCFAKVSLIFGKNSYKSSWTVNGQKTSKTFKEFHLKPIKSIFTDLFRSNSWVEGILSEKTIKGRIKYLLGLFRGLLKFTCN